VVESMLSAGDISISPKKSGMADGGDISRRGGCSQSEEL
jgi:hypothetical protein